MNEKLFIHCGRKTVSVNLADIIMVESYEGMSKFSIANKSPLIWADSLSHVRPRLPEGFYQINRSMIINTLHVEAIDWQILTIQLTGGLKVKISYRRKKDLKEKMEGIVNYK
jgi:DNA-binding LytR/AlgR family response regulator